MKGSKQIPFPFTIWNPTSSLGRSTAIALTLFLTACSGTITEPEAGPSFHVADEEAIVLHLRAGPDRIEGEIPFRLANRTDRMFAVANCNGVYDVALQRWDGSNWVVVYSNVVPDCLGPPIMIASGDVFVDSFQIYAHPGSGTDDPPWSLEAIDGRYRLVIFPQWDAGGGDGRMVDVPDEHRVSNEFRIRIEGA